MAISDDITRQLEGHADDFFRWMNHLSFADLEWPAELLLAPFEYPTQWVHRHREVLIPELDGCLSGSDSKLRRRVLAFLTRRTIRYLQGRNPYLELDGEQAGRLERLFIELLHDARRALATSNQEGDVSAALAKLVATFLEDLHAFVIGLTSANLGSSFVFGPVVAGEFSPELQLKILGVQPADLEEPILDLGCGSGAPLVHYLSERGKRVVGVDRAVDIGGSAIESDWFDFELGARRWGTIISHMALSLHFLHHHLRPGGHPERFAQLYMKVLRALAQSGSFLYAPGLPFIEDLLPRDRYSVSRTPCAELLQGSADRSFRQVYGMDVLYACRITHGQGVP